MKAHGVKGTDQGLVTTYKTFTSQYINYIYNRFTFKDQARYSTHKNRFVSTITFCTAMKKRM